MHCIRFQLSLLFPTKTHSLHFLELELQLKHGTRLGHPSLSNFKHVLSSIPIKGSTVLPYCEFCSYAKSCKIPFGCSETVAKLPLELVVMFGVLPLFYLFMILSSVLFSLMILPNIHGCSPYMLSQMFLKSFLLLNYKLKNSSHLKSKHLGQMVGVNS